MIAALATYVGVFALAFVMMVGWCRLTVPDLYARHRKRLLIVTAAFCVTLAVFFFVVELLGLGKVLFGWMSAGSSQ